MMMRKTIAVMTVLMAAVICVGCQQRVVRETSYSPEQFPQYSHLPRISDQEQEESSTDWVGEATGTMKRWGNTATNKMKNVGRTIGGWMPTWGDE